MHLLNAMHVKIAHNTFVDHLLKMVTNATGIKSFPNAYYIQRLSFQSSHPDTLPEIMASLVASASRGWSGHASRKLVDQR